LGQGLSPQLVEHLTTEVENALTQRVRLGHIQNFSFRFLSSPVMQVLGEVEFFLEIVPSFEIRKIRIRAGLTMPKRALVAAASA